MQFFINASGCEGHITSEMQTRMENSEIIYKMTKEFDWVFKYLKSLKNFNYDPTLQVTRNWNSTDLNMFFFSKTRNIQ